LAEEDLVLIEENKRKKRKFDELRKKIKLLESISFVSLDSTSGKNKSIDGRILAEQLYTAFPIFFDSDKRLTQISLQNMEIIERYLARLFSYFSRKHDDTEDAVGKKIQQFRRIGKSFLGDRNLDFDLDDL
jgi:hypothetical protein